eukprot:TRINITY_DN3254_c1_g2_i1.p1 TRINITY_DN3254_c1_g2~~TRINITY_DN3254_c1_g2_i1.p1  ORF type:complete len:244 (+),score=13.07 TRINITY_DN3254_c1_g2_i1:39-770(+)
MCRTVCCGAFMSLISLLCMIAGTLLPWYLMTASASGGIFGMKGDVSVSEVLWWRQVYTTVYINGDREGDLSDDNTYKDASLPETEKLFLGCVCIMTAASVCALGTTACAIAIWSRSQRHESVLLKVTACVLGVCAIVLAAAAASYFAARVSEGLVEDHKNHGKLLLVPPHDSFWGHDSGQWSFPGPITMKGDITWVPVGWFMPIPGVVFMVAGLVVITFCARPNSNYEYSILSRNQGLRAVNH